MSTTSPISRKETRARLRADHERLVEQLRTVRSDNTKRARLHPSYICVWLHRWSHHNYRNGHRRLARILWHLNTIITGADIAEMSDIGPGLLIPTPACVAIMCSAGCNLTVMAFAGLGGELNSREDIGAGPGLPVVGDDVTIGAHAGVLGPVRIGDRVSFEPLAVASRNVPADQRVISPRFRTIDTEAAS